jgi:tRNA threonylcarbamoyladenosine biosynthesis protein TsaB
VAVLRAGRVLAERATAMRGADEERLMPAVAAVLESARVAAADIDAIVCGGGPGSFTSLRIAGAIAKGLASATGAPLFAVPSLALVALAGAPSGGGAPAGSAAPARVLATMDAMRGDRYAAVVGVARDAQGEAVVTSYAFLGVVAGDAVAALARSQAADLHVDAGEAAPEARGLGAFALALPRAGRSGPAAALALAPVSLAAWEPDYGRKAEAQVQWELAHGRALPGDAPAALAGRAAGHG